jgi:hypothetical protein
VLAPGWTSTDPATRADCDDFEPHIYPDSTQTGCWGEDVNCDHHPDATNDHDGDGFTSCCHVDCDDRVGTGAAVFPGATESAGDAIDQNCDGVELCFTDGDGDGFHGDATVAVSDIACTGAGHFLLSQARDCCDTDPLAYPAASAWRTAADGCGSFDYNCSGSPEPRYTAISTAHCVGACDAMPPVPMCHGSGTTGWVDVVAGCGETAVWTSAACSSDIDPDTGACVCSQAPGTTRVQSCH